MINFKVRARSGKFWVAIVSAVALFLKQLLSAFGVEFDEETINQTVDAIFIFLSLLATFGVITDPTVKGLQDSDLVMMKNHPTNPRQQVLIVDESAAVEEPLGTDSEIKSHLEDGNVPSEKEVNDI